ncbi:MAG TPA: hypothetical protein VHO48_00985 [Anaerolineaceae bacterium]|nr:hypothetical protein [Anaerolineaceae bacterium]
MITSLDSAAYLREAEDPNRDYPSGHYLPFPLALATVSGSDGFWAEIQVTP